MRVVAGAADTYVLPAVSVTEAMVRLDSTQSTITRFRSPAAWAPWVARLNTVAGCGPMSPIPCTNVGVCEPAALNAAIC